MTFVLPVYVLIALEALVLALGFQWNVSSLSSELSIGHPLVKLEQRVRAICEKDQQRLRAGVHQV